MSSTNTEEGSISRRRNESNRTRSSDSEVQRISESKPLTEILSQVFEDEKEGHINVTELLSKINQCGFLAIEDIRLRPLIDRLLIKTVGTGTDKYNIYNIKKSVPVSDLKDLPNSCKDIIKKTLFGKALIPEFSRFADDLLTMFNSVAEIKTGKIPEFLSSSTRNVDQWGVTVCTVDGQIWSCGDSNIPITLQSCSAAINYAIAITKLGTKHVHKFVGKEASTHGMMNTLDLDKNDVPHNAMIQSGAMAITSLLLKEHPNDLPSSYESVVNIYQRLAGNKPLKINNTVYLADKSRSDRKFSIAYLLKEHNGFPDNMNLKHIIDLYFQLNSVEVTCQTGAVMAATLANGGVCPTTCDEILSRTAVQNTLSIMHLQGMYSYSGEWMFQAGLPAKSSTSGLIMMVVPGMMGMCLFSPPLDPNGNSTRALEFGRRMAQRFALHYLDNHISAPVRKENLSRRQEGTESHELVIMKVMYAAAHGDFDLLRRYHELGLSMDVVDYDHRTPMHLACCNDNIEVAKFLIDLDVNVCAMDRWNRTPLDDAKQYGNEEIVELLRKHGASEGPGPIEIEKDE